MGRIWIKEFTGGLDTRRMPVTTAGGVLVRANDAHINRGGEFEQRAAFVKAYTLPPAATVGLAAGKTSLFVFGHNTTPSMPSGVSYQQIQHPDTVTALTRTRSYDLYKGKIYVAAEFADGSISHFYDGSRVTDWFDGRSRAAFSVVSGGVTSTLNLKVDGVSIMSGANTWATSNSATAAAIAADINSNPSTPEYTATSVGPGVNVVADTPGAAFNGKALAFTLTNAFTIDPTSEIVLAGGVDSATAFVPGTFVRTIGSRMHALSGSNEHFSGIQEPTKWTTDTVGAGFIDMSSEASGSEVLTSLGKYQNLVAVFAATIVQLWFIDPDPTQNVQKQVLNNTGTECGRSVTQFGDSDLFYYHESGIRSLRARDASNAAATTDIGVPIDDLTSAKIASLTTEQREKVIGLVNPSDGRFWMITFDTIFVFSYFPGVKVSAWSVYKPSAFVGGVSVPFTIDDAVVFKRKVYLRSGDNIYVYGGLGSTPEYDGTVAEGWLPYLDGDSPTKEKTLKGVDVAVVGTWQVSVAMDPNDESVEELMLTATRTTFNEAMPPAEHRATHFSLRFRSLGVGPAKVSSAVIHHDGDPSED